MNNRRRFDPKSLLSRPSLEYQTYLMIFDLAFPVGDRIQRVWGRPGRNKAASGYKTKRPSSGACTGQRSRRRRMDLMSHQVGLCDLRSHYRYPSYRRARKVPQMMTCQCLQESPCPGSTLESWKSIYRHTHIYVYNIDGLKYLFIYYCTDFK